MIGNLLAKKSKVRDAAEKPEEKSEAVAELDRDEQLLDSPGVREALLDIYKDIEKGFEGQAERSDANMDYWDLYNNILGANQFYQGNSEIFVPIIYNAINARKTRFSNQLFPVSGRYIEVTTEDGAMPQAEMALLENYIRRAKLRTRVAPAIVKNGDIEGQMTIQVTWQEHKRHVVQRVHKAPEVEGEPADTGDDDDKVEDIEEETIRGGGPHVDVIADSDLLLLPATAADLSQALRDGGSVTTICRWTKTKLMRMVAEEEIDKDAGEELLEEMKKEAKPGEVDKPKAMVDAAGIKGVGKFALVYRTWTVLKIGEERRLCLCYFGGPDRLLSCKRNPYWSDRIDIFSAPVNKVEGSFKGISLLQSVATLQIQANDAVNEGMDSAAYALMPIVMTDPERNPRVGSMILSLAAVWETDPNSTKFAQFPPLWKDALEIVAACKTEIFQTLSVNPAQITQAMGKAKKPNQAEIANEQQVDILTTADAVTVIEDEIFSPMAGFMLELDHQFRDETILVRAYGETGMRASMQEIPPIQMNKHYEFRWFGVEAARNAQQVQQQIAFINVVKGIPPNMYPGYKLDLGPALAQGFENTFGPRIAPLVFRDARTELSVDPNVENDMLAEGFVVPVHMSDDHEKHLKAHMQRAKTEGDPHGTYRVHIMAHMQALQAAQQAHQQNQQPQGGGGTPQQGGGGPRQGAQNVAPRGGQNPPGAIHRDKMQDPAAAPRAQ